MYTIALSYVLDDVCCLNSWMDTYMPCLSSYIIVNFKLSIGKVYFFDDCQKSSFTLVCQIPDLFKFLKNEPEFLLWFLAPLLHLPMLQSFLHFFNVGHSAHFNSGIPISVDHKERNTKRDTPNW